MQRRHKTPQCRCFSISGRALLDRRSEAAETPTHRMDFLWTRLTAALCCSALVVIKNRPLPFPKRGHCGVLFYSVLHPAPKRPSGQKECSLLSNS